MEMRQTKCAICNSIGNYTIVYKSNFNPTDINRDVFSARRMPDLIHYQMVRCNNDSLVRSNPVYKDANIEALYRGSKFNYVEQINNITASYLSVLDKVLPFLSRDAKILEIGCGNGFILSALLSKGYNNVFGVEPSMDAVSKADRMIKGRIFPDILKEGVYENGSFQFIFLFQTLDHIEDPAHFLNICYNLLSPGGYILALNHDIESFSSRLLKDKSPIIDIEHTYLYSKRTIRKMFSKSGFESLKVFSPKSVLSIRYLMWLFPMPQKLKITLINLKGLFLKFLLKQTIRIPIGNLCIIARKPIRQL
jgi:SAM-dependent methyltransferase